MMRSSTPEVASFADSKIERSWIEEIDPDRRPAIPTLAQCTSPGGVGWLARLVETEIIPRLVSAHRDDLTAEMRPAGEEASWGALVCPVDPCVTDFSQILLSGEKNDAMRYIEAQRIRGQSLESIYLDLIAPTGHRLTALWDEDLANFADITIAVWRLQQILHELSPVFCAEGEVKADPRRVLLLSAPGDRQTLGLSLMVEFFRRDGWEVSGQTSSSPDARRLAMQAGWIDVVAFGAGRNVNLVELAAEISSVRECSRNPEIRVLVDGQLFLDQPELCSQVGADAAVVDAFDALRLAEVLLSKEVLQT